MIDCKSGTKSTRWWWKHFVLEAKNVLKIKIKLGDKLKGCRNQLEKVIPDQTEDNVIIIFGWKGLIMIIP